MNIFKRFFNKNSNTSNDDVVESDSNNLSDYTLEEYDILKWLAENITTWAVPSYSYVTRTRKEVVTDNSSQYTTLYSKRPRANGVYFTRDEVEALQMELRRGEDSE